MKSQAEQYMEHKDLAKRLTEHIVKDLLSLPNPTVNTVRGDVVRLSRVIAALVTALEHLPKDPNQWEDYHYQREAESEYHPD